MRIAKNYYLFTQYLSSKIVCLFYKNQNCSKWLCDVRQLCFVVALLLGFGLFYKLWTRNVLKITFFLQMKPFFEWLLKWEILLRSWYTILKMLLFFALKYFFPNPPCRRLVRITYTNVTMNCSVDLEVRYIKLAKINIVNIKTTELP